MSCPSCGSEDISWSGTYFKGKRYDRACNKCGYCWNINEKCAICERNIKEINAFPIYSNKFGVICSFCCFVGASYFLGIVKEDQLIPIPIKIREKIKQIYNKEENNENKDKNH